jgi:hypothetical protein
VRVVCAVVLEVEAAAWGAGEGWFGCARGVWNDCANGACGFVDVVVVVAGDGDVFRVWVALEVEHAGCVCVECCGGEVFGHHQGEEGAHGWETGTYDAGIDFHC